MKITKVYTKTGDEGTTSLVGGVRISKADIRIEAYGTVDELNSHIGLLSAYVTDESIDKVLTRIQSDLFIVGTHLATDQSNTPLYSSAILSEGEVEFVEKEIDSILSELPEKLGFVLPGGTICASQAHVCRTVSRRAERCVIRLAQEATVGKEIVQFLNRLSDYFFVLAKKMNKIEGKSEKIWQKPCK
ncbi:MAG: cob(I)yrinic acid a,c-diamide adenosyltransferase [Prevotella sp.]